MLSAVTWYPVFEYLNNIFSFNIFNAEKLVVIYVKKSL